MNTSMQNYYYHQVSNRETLINYKTKMNDNYCNNQLNNGGYINSGVYSNLEGFNQNDGINNNNYVSNYYRDNLIDLNLPSSSSSSSPFGGIGLGPSSDITSSSTSTLTGIGFNYPRNIEQHTTTPSGPQTYYEPPIFHLPPTSCYAHTQSYGRHHNVTPNQWLLASPQSFSEQSIRQFSWYHYQQQQQQHQQQPQQHQHQQFQHQQQLNIRQYGQNLNMLQFSNSNGREARNKAEKNRRDKLNGSIQELSTMVPHVAESPRRVDKTAVLRFSAHGLRIHYVFKKTINKNPAVKSQVTDSLMRLLDSFLITVTCRGQIVLISPSVEQHLGHCQTDLFGQNILQITHPDDHAMLKKLLIPTDLETLFDIQPEDENGEPRPRTQEEEEEIDRKLREDKRNFTIRLAKAGPRSEPTTYEIVKIDGCFRRADSTPRGVKSSTFPSGLQLIRRARGREDSIPLHSISENDVVLVAMARVIRPPKIERIIEANQYEYKTRHLIDGRIIQCDQRISLVAGYMTDEVNGLSPFTFIHQDDVKWVIVALRQMYDCNSAYGESCYRLMNGTGNFIYLRSRGYLEIDKDTNKVHSFVCVNTLVGEEEGKRRVQEMKNKFSVYIKEKIPPSAIDAPAAENPQQLEKAVIYLIKNLEKYAEDDGDASSYKLHRDGSENDSSRYVKSPPLALIPPKACTIKSSITKSVSVVCKTLRAHHSKSPSTASEGESSRESTDIYNENKNQCINSVIKKNGDNVKTKDNSESRVPPLPNSKGYFDGCYSSPEYCYSNSSGQSLKNSVLKRSHTNDDNSEDEKEVKTKKRNLIEEAFFLNDTSLDEFTNSNQILPDSFVEVDHPLPVIENLESDSNFDNPTSDMKLLDEIENPIDEIINESQSQNNNLNGVESQYSVEISNNIGVDPRLISPAKDGVNNHNVQKSTDFKTR